MGGPLKQVGESPVSDAQQGHPHSSSEEGKSLTPDGHFHVSQLLGEEAARQQGLEPF